MTRDRDLANTAQLALYVELFDNHRDFIQLNLEQAKKVLTVLEKRGKCDDVIQGLGLKIRPYGVCDGMELTTTRPYDTLLIFQDENLDQAIQHLRTQIDVFERITQSLPSGCHLAES